MDIMDTVPVIPPNIANILQSTNKQDYWSKIFFEN